MFALLLFCEIAAAATMIEHRRPEINSAAVMSLLLLILIAHSSLICLTSAARQSAVFNTGMGDKHIKGNNKTSGFRQIKPSKDCHSKINHSDVHCSTPPVNMKANVTGAEKRVVPTGPNPLHNR